MFENQPDNPLESLDFRVAIEAHMEWEVRLRNFIGDSSQDKITVEFIEKDNNCLLGKWIYSLKDEDVINKFEFKLLKSIHTCFHLQAAQILETALKGNRESAMALLDSGDYRFLSDKVKILLTKLHLNQY